MDFLATVQILAVHGVTATLGEVHLVSKTNQDLTGSSGLIVQTRNIGIMLTPHYLHQHENVKRVNLAVGTQVFTVTLF